MNPSDLRKAAALVSQHKQEATIAETDQLSSMPLSQISIDDNGPPVVHYGSLVPVAASTPRGTTPHMYSSPQEDSYLEIIPGIPQGSLYPEQLRASEVKYFDNTVRSTNTLPM